MDIALIIGFTLLVSALEYLTGAFIVSLADGFFDVKTIRSVALTFLVGFVVHLFVSYWLICSGVNWWVSVFALLTPGLITLMPGRRLALSDFRLRMPGVNRVVWTLLTGALGFTLLVHQADYSTYWEPAAGDYAFHISTIYSFVFGHNFPANYPIFAGLPLSYPFMAELWTAILWSCKPVTDTLPVVFVIQWVILTQIVFSLLDGGRRWIFPWLLLLGGGSFLLFVHTNEYSWQLIRDVKEMPWSTFLASVWIPQRSALAGAAIAVGVTRLLLVEVRSRADVVLAAILLGLGPLVQAQFFVVAALTCGLAILFECIVVRWQHANTSWSLTTDEVNLTILTLLTTFLALPGLTVLAAKGSLITLIYGWNVPMPKHVTAGRSIIDSLGMWVTNCWPWFLAVAYVGARYRRGAWLLAMLILFVLANVLQVAVWEWDQVKFFVAIYVVFVAVWAMSVHRLNAVEVMIAVLLCLPAVFEYGRFSVSERVHYVIFRGHAIKLANDLRQVLPEHAVLTGAPEYNNATLLTGRPVFTSEPYWLYTHHIDFWRRDQVNANLDALAICRRGHFGIAPEHCPDFLLWDERAIRYWHRQMPPAEFKAVARFDGDVLYAVPGTSVDLNRPKAENQ